MIRRQEMLAMKDTKFHRILLKLRRRLDEMMPGHNLQLVNESAENSIEMSPVRVRSLVGSS